MSAITGPNRCSDVEMRLPSDPSAPARARASVRELDGTLSSSLVERLSLVASELVTNALRHAIAADPAPRMTVALEPGRVVLAVSDQGSLFDPGAWGGQGGPDGGFGLPLVDSIADRWRVEIEPNTRVICEFDR
jgi:anti-sigma regulatory factor (Ser/Thr protein kinase)